MRTTLTILLAACIATAGAVGCSSSNNNPDGGLPDAASDAASDVNNTNDGSSDAGDGSCNFAAFVIGLIDADTTMSATPSVDLGQNCVDDHNQADFAQLFP
jgi:hypothetical protein